MKRAAALLGLFSLTAVPAAWSQEAPEQPSPPWTHSPYGFQGEVLAIDPEAGTIEARIVAAAGPFDEGPRVEPFTATIRTDADTEVFRNAEPELPRNAEPATVGDIRRGDVLGVVIHAEHGLTREQVLERPAHIVAAFHHPAYYGFGGRVRHVDAADGTLTLSVRLATPAAAELLARNGDQRTLTFTIDADTEIVRNGRRVDASALQRGDVAGVGVLASRAMELGEVLATPAAVVIAVQRTRAAAGSFGTLSRKAARRVRSLLP